MRATRAQAHTRTQAAHRREVHLLAVAEVPVAVVIQAAVAVVLAADADKTIDV